MHLDRLELIGFKSFAQKTVLEFPGGITAIVGPNGSGKSNVIDAIRWLLGEREAKNVRGSRTEDLIFAGTPARARMGLAEVRLVFNNANRMFPLEFAEVAIRRRVTRDGTTHYFINDAEVRLKDAVDLFAQARLGTKGFTIINQGESDLFVRSAPRDRRVMLEEILGLRQYELKRHDAEHKLAATRINMDKVKALLDEIAPHLRLLRRQTARWEKHAEYEAELKALEAEFYGAQYAALKRDAEILEPGEREIESELAKKEEEKRRLEARLREVEEETPKGSGDFEAARRKQEALFARRGTIEKDLGKLEVRMELLYGRGNTVADPVSLVKAVRDAREAIRAILGESDAAKAHAALEAILRELDRVLGEKSEARAEEERELKEAKANLSVGLAALDREIKEQGEFEKKLTAGLSDFNAAFKKAYGALEAKKNEIAALLERRQKAMLERERVTLRREELDHQVRQAMRKPEEFSGLMGAASKDAGELAALERRVLRLRGELASIGDIDPALLKETEETAKRHEFLSSQLKDLEQAAKDLSALTKELSSRIHVQFSESLHGINAEFSKYVHTMFDGGRARLVVLKPEKKIEEGEPGTGDTVSVPAAGSQADEEFTETGIEIEISIPRKKISSLEMLSGGERSLVSLAVLFALISVSPPPFLVLDEVDAALDEANSRRFAELVKQFEKKTQFVIVTHNRATMEAANVLYGVTMADDGTSRVLSLKLEEAEREAVQAAY